MVGPRGPGALESERAELRLPPVGFFLRIEQRVNGAGNNRNVGAPGKLQRAQSVLRFFFYPLVAGHQRDAQHLNIGRLRKHQDRLHVRGSRTARILIDNHFLFRLLGDRRKRRSRSIPRQRNRPIRKLRFMILLLIPSRTIEEQREKAILEVARLCTYRTAEDSFLLAISASTSGRLAIARAPTFVQHSAAQAFANRPTRSSGHPCNKA